MNKKRIKSCLLVSALALCFSGSLFAADIENGKVVSIANEPPAPEIYGNQLIFSNVNISKHADRAKKSTTVSAAAAASGISYYEIYAVGSSYAGWEYPSSYQTVTTSDHGGGTLLIAVIQYGYGTPNPATMNGVSKSASSRTLCGPMTSLHYCSAGETVTGWMHTFDFSGQQSGSFVTSANSTAYPYGYWQDSIYIK